MGKAISNPYRPGAGHPPPHLAGRHGETAEFRRLLRQEVILENMVLTGLRGVGKTVLLDTFKPIAIQANWYWVGTDLSESTSMSEDKIALRLITDLSVVTSGIVLRVEERRELGFSKQSEQLEYRMDFAHLAAIFDATPGLVADKLKAVLEYAWAGVQKESKNGIVFAYDEAQTIADHADRDQYPLSLLLDVFQSIQRKKIPFMLVLTGLPTLFPKLVEARTFAERMFRVVFLDRLSREDSESAILRPLEVNDCPVHFEKHSVQAIYEDSGGYPYFVQFICREAFDVFIQQVQRGEPASVPRDAIIRKLDTDFFAGRWSRATDRQRDMLTVIAALENCHEEFSGQDVVQMSEEILDRPFSSSHANQMIAKLSELGLVYKNRHGKYSFAVPLMDRFIRRQTERQ